MYFMVYFVSVDHHSDDCSYTEQMIVEADTEQEAGKKFYSENDMSGCYVKKIVPFTY
jgi:hypothetical protein